MATRLASWKTRQTLLGTSLALSRVFIESTDKKYTERVCVHFCTCCVCVYARVRAHVCVVVAIGGGGVIEEKKVLEEEDNQPSRTHQYQRTHTEADKSKLCVSVHARTCVYA